MHVITARLAGGPRDGFSDRILAPGPELVVVEWYAPWRRHVLVEVTGDWPGADLYLRDREAADAPELVGAGAVLFRYLDPDVDFAAALELPWGEPLTAASAR